MSADIDSMPGKLEALRTDFTGLREDFSGLHLRVGGLEKAVATNTEMTARNGDVIRDQVLPVVTAIHEEQLAKKWLGRKFTGVGKIAAAGTAILTAVSAVAAGVWHFMGGKP